MKRYFEIGKATPHTPILSLREGKISHYDELFKKVCSRNRLGLAVCWPLWHIRSRTSTTTAVSWAGARGLMQLMPATATGNGAARRKGTEPGREREGCREIHQAPPAKSFSSRYPRKNGINFVLASYNSGIGHVQDAMALAEKYGKEQVCLARQRRKLHLIEKQ